MSTYLFALVDGGGTVPPELAAARRLVERGHVVTVLAEDSMAPDVRATGATYRPWVEAPNRPDRRPEHDPYRDWEVSSPLQLFDRLLDLQFIGPARGYIADVDAAVAERRPDLVVCSQFAFGAMTAAEAAGIPFDVLMPNIYLLPAPGMTPIGSGTRPARGPLGRTRDRMTRAVMQRVWDKGRGRLNEIRQECGLPPVRHFMDQARAARRHLVMTSPDFDFPGRLPDNARYVGPVLDDPTWSGSEAWTAPAGTDPLVLVSLSSTFQDHEATLQRIVDAMGTLPVRAVVTTGPALGARFDHRRPERHGGRRRAAPPGARRGGGDRHPRRPRDRRQGAGRRGPDGRAAARTGPGRQRGAGQRARSRGDAAA